MKLKKFGATEQRIYEMVTPMIEKMGYLVWDVRYEKEGADWYLRIFIDSENAAISIQDCEKVTRPVSDMLDEEDPIPHHYILEVSSVGLDAELLRESHFDACIGCEVRARGIRPLPDGSREVIGILTAWDKDSVTVESGGQTQELPLSALAFVKLYFEFSY